jgi:hypothetical protein
MAAASSDTAQQQGSSAQSGGGCKRLHWFTAVSGGHQKHAPAGYLNYAAVALLTAKNHAPSLVPHLIHQGEP